MGERISNDEIIKQLKEALASMEINEENRFSIRAYQNAIVSIENLTTSVYDLWEDNRLRDIEGVGSGLQQHLDELFQTGKVKEWEERKEELPEGMFELISIRGVGAKTAFKLAKHFKLDSRDDALKKVKEAAEKEEIRKLSGFGEKSEQDILESIEDLKKSKNEKERMLYVHAKLIADRVVDYLKELEEVEEAVPLGSLRRKLSTIGDIDIAVASNEPEKVIEHFVKYPEIKDIETQGDKMSTVILGIGAQIDILVSEPDSFGSMLQHFTGSKLHNIKLRQYALDKEMSLSQYGIKEDGKLKKFKTEEGFYKHLGLDWVPPEIREGGEEIELAQESNLPKLIEVGDIKGDIHTHTTASDGIATLEEMVESAKAKGYKYYGVADHAPSVTSRGRYEVLGIVDSTKMRISKINEEQDDIKVLFGYEVNILKDKTLGMPDEILDKLDYVIASIHTSFTEDRDLQTERLIAAIENPYVDIIGHPTGRMINEREPIDVDWDKILEAAKNHDKILEINSQPKRLDLPPNLIKDAISVGVKLTINTDAHAPDDLDFMEYGVSVAKRGWATEENIVNTLPTEDFIKLFEK